MAKKISSERAFSSEVLCVFGLLIKCPLESSQQDCPLNALRQGLGVGLEDKLNYAQTLSEKELSEILQHHQRCFSKRIGALNKYLHY